MLKIVLHLFSTKQMPVQEEVSPSLTESNNVLIDYWMIEGPRSYRQSILSDKIRRLDICRNFSHWK
jgi:hypothetical protein